MQKITPEVIAALDTLRKMYLWSGEPEAQTFQILDNADVFDAIDDAAEQCLCTSSDLDPDQWGVLTAGPRS